MSTGLEPAEISGDELRRVWGQFVTGVTIVTAIDGDANPVGLTANSYTSVSLDPPLVLVSIDKQGGSHPGFFASPGFIVHILSAHQQPLAERFSDPGIDRWEELSWEPGWQNVPKLSGMLGWLECQTIDQVDAGDHTLFVGQVKAIELAEESEPALVFWQGNYHTFGGGGD